jgi:hypothetical protein
MCKQELLVQISSIVENSNKISSNPIEFQTLEIACFLIQIFSRILKSSYKESYSLIQNLHNHILFEIFRVREGIFSLQI